MTEKTVNSNKIKTKHALEISTALLGLTVVSASGTQVAHADTVKTPVVATTKTAKADTSKASTLDIKTANGVKDDNSKKDTKANATGDTKAYDDAVKYNDKLAKDNKAVNEAKTNRDKAVDSAKQAGVKVTKDQTQKYDSADKAKDDYEAQTSDINKKVADYKAKQEAHDKAQATADTVKDSQEAKDLHSAVSDAQKVDGITVVKDADKVTNVDADKVADAINSAKQNDKDQINPIRDAIAKQEKDNAEYAVKKAEYDKKYQAFVDHLKQLGLWHEGATDPSTLSQHFQLPNQPYAKVDAQLLQNVGTLDKNTQTLTFDEKNGANAVKGDFMKLTYTNLKGASYDGTPIDKIVLTLSDKEARTPTSWSNVGTLQYHNDPTYGWTYIGYRGLTGTLQFYDKQGNQIDFSKDKSAYMTVSSLNTFDMGNGQTSPEKVKLLSDGEGITLAESSITVHDGNVLYSEKPNNDEDLLKNFGQGVKDKYTGWDNANQASRIFGSGLFKIVGNSVKLQTYSDGRNSAWFALSTTIPPTTLDDKAPVKPTATINWHDNSVKVNEPVAPEVHVHDAEYPAQTANASKVSVIDDTTGKTIYQEAINGKTGDSVIFPNLPKKLDELKANGYKVVSNNSQGKKFNSDLTKNIFEVHVKKDTTPSTPNTDKPTTPVKPNNNQPQGSKPTESENVKPAGAETKPTAPNKTVAPKATAKPKASNSTSKAQPVKNANNVSAPVAKTNNSSSAPVAVKSADNQLPQTGDKANKGAVVAGLASVLGAIGLGFLAHKKHKEQQEQGEQAE